MSDVTHEIIELDGGWAYKIGDWISPSFPSRAAALIGAEQGVADQEARRDSAGDASADPAEDPASQI